MSSQIYYSIAVVITAIFLLFIWKLFLPWVFKKAISIIRFKPVNDFLTEIQSDISRLVFCEIVLFIVLANLDVWFGFPFRWMINIMVTVAKFFAIGIMFAFVSVISVYIEEHVKSSEMNDKDKKIALTLIPILGSVVRYLCFGIVAVMIIKLWGVDITPILTGTAFVLAILGLAGQAIIQDLLAFVSLIIDRPFYVGSDIEWIHDGWWERGIVEQITLRNTVIKNDDGYLFYMPNRLAGTFRVWRK